MKGFACDVVGMLHEQRISAVFHEKTHDIRLGKPGGQPERGRTDQGRSEIEIMG